MFRNACAIAREFTRPVILCRKTVSGVCSSSIGSFIVLNNEGWILTAGHIIDQLDKLVAEEKATRDHPTRLAAIKSDSTLSKKDKYDLIKALGKIMPDATERAAANWHFPGAVLTQAKRHGVVDIAVGKLEPFDPSWVTTYPVIKDPQKDFEPGASLCKYGYPFHTVVPSFDDAAGSFTVEGDPLPLFPMEGIFTRGVNYVVPGGPPSPYPLIYLETSSPGLRGQSGGPTFDVHGAIWAIQSQTHHLHLGFNPPIPGGKNGETEHQFLNVGWGVHSTTILGVLAELGVTHTVSAF
ncbi:hypothetical protein GCM10011529_18750 [Polymorphobacter glacialis]|uniref:Serine protease n=1 Tax=Sandarakinorhabdus glacialis TaxID=1614636 RepID=A0A916ZTM7_9SPHN|nr:trypsin-like peptidase domain-containing protein [Polymorphobacter glacialis]GGE12616.1 hypothetical protein GCM10011529_18750 [Polymorphobacter glacialis]